MNTGFYVTGRLFGRREGMALRRSLIVIGEDGAIHVYTKSVAPDDLPSLKEALDALAG